MTRKIWRGLASVGLAAGLALYAAPLRAGSTHFNFSVAPGISDFAVFADGTNVRLVLGGNPQLQILRIVGGEGLPDISFTDASPSDITRFFNVNPDRFAVRITLTVSNPTDRTLQLAVTALSD